MSGTCTSDTLMGLAGADANGVWSAANLKDPLDPEWDEDPAMVEYRETIREYQPDGFRDQRHRGLRLHAGRGVGRGPRGAEAPARRALMEALHDLDVSEVGLLLPGVTVATGPDDAYMGEALQPPQYEFTGDANQGQRNHLVPQGDIVDFEGETATLPPEDLING